MKTQSTVLDRISLRFRENSETSQNAKNNRMFWLRPFTFVQSMQALGAESPLNSLEAFFLAKHTPVSFPLKCTHFCPPLHPWLGCQKSPSCIWQFIATRLTPKLSMSRSMLLTLRLRFWVESGDCFHLQISKKQPHTWTSWEQNSFWK